VRLVLLRVTVAPTRALAAEEVPEGGAEGRGTLRPPEAANRGARLVVVRPVGVRVLVVAAVFFLFVFLVVIVVHAEAEPGSDTLQTIPNSHPASLRAILL
jgi:hypothetical protein